MAGQLWRVSCGAWACEPLKERAHAERRKGSIDGLHAHRKRDGWPEDGTRHYIESSDDDGATWKRA